MVDSWPLCVPVKRTVGRAFLDDVAGNGQNILAVACSLYELCLNVVSMHRKHIIQCLSSSMSYSWGTVFWE